MDKFEELHTKITEILIWAEEQGHINEDQKYLLMNAIDKEKDYIQEQE